MLQQQHLQSQHHLQQQEHYLYHQQQLQLQQQQQQQQPHQYHHEQYHHLQQQQQQQQHQQQPMLEDADKTVQHLSTKDQLIILVQRLQQTDGLNQSIKNAQEEFRLQLEHRSRLLQTVAQQESLAQRDLATVDKAKRDLSKFECILKEQASELNKVRCKLLAELQDIFGRMCLIQQAVLFEHLPKWHQDQQLANTDTKMDSTALDQIQALVEMLIDIALGLRYQLKGLQSTLYGKHVPFNLEELDQFGLRINRSLEDLILRGFVVEKQPPQVMKTNTRFTSTVRFLGGDKLAVKMIRPTVKVTILSETNARAIIQRHQELIQASWEYLDRQQLGAAPHQLKMEQQQPVYSNLPPIDNQYQTAGQAPAQQQVLQQAAPQPFFQQQYPPLQSQPPAPQQPQFHVHAHQSSLAGTPYNQPERALGQHMATYYSHKILNMNEFEPSGEILNNSNSLEYQDATGQLICHFRNMQLKKIKRPEKKGTESVMDEKFVLLFHTEFSIPDDRSRSGAPDAGSWVNGELSYHIMAFSLPVVVIVHGNQEPHAWATVTWHNAFAKPDGLLYRVPDKVCWRDLGQVLSDKFWSCAGRALSAQNLEYLGSKVYRNRVESDDVIVTWNQFAKEPLPEKTFTFWEWFHSILKLTKEHLKDLWSDEKIYGFVGKKRCVDLLLGSAHHEPRPLGTFLLRYSETELGGITIAWVSGPSQAGGEKNGVIQIFQRHSPTNSSSNVLSHLQPFVSKDLNTRSLADRIRDLEDLVYLYPDTPKDGAFKAYYTPLIDTTPMSDGYVKPMLIQTLVTNYPKNSTANSMDCAVTTPSSFSQSSPDGIYQDNAFMSDVETIYPTYDSTVVSEFNNAPLE